VGEPGESTLTDLRGDGIYHTKKKDTSFILSGRRGETCRWSRSVLAWWNSISTNQRYSAYFLTSL